VAPDPAGARRRSRLTALRVALGYAGLASLWILLSDRWVEQLLADPEARTLASIAKGWVFVAVTSLLLYVLVRRLAPRGGSRMGPASSSQRTLAVLVGATILLLTVAGLALALRQQRQTAELSLRSIASLRATQASAWAAARLADGDRVREIQPSRLRERLELLRSERGYVAAALLDAQWRVVWSSGAAPDTPQDVAGTRADRPRLLGPQLDAEGLPHLMLLVPLQHGQSPAGGFALLQLAAADMPPLSLGQDTVDGVATVLVRRDGDDLVYFGTPTRKGFALWRRPADESAIAATADPEGTLIDGSDERGLRAQGLLDPVAGTPWRLLTRVEHAALERQRWQAASGVLLAALLAGFGASGLLALRRQREAIDHHEAERRRQGERMEALAVFEAIADSSPDMIFAKDMAGRYLLFNRGAERFTGASREQMLGRDDSVLFAPEVVVRLRADDQRAQEGVIELEESLPTPDGPREMTVTKGPLRNRAGELIGVFGVSRDVTELSKERALLAETSRIARIGGWSYDDRTRRVTWTDEIRRIVEVDGEIDPGIGFALGFLGDEAREQLLAALQANREHGVPLDLELPVHTARGRERWVRLVGQLEFDGRRVLHAQGFVQDVTESKTLRLELDRHRAELERQVRERTADLEVARARAEAGMRARDAFVRIISHELRTPLHQILNLAPHLHRDDGSPEDAFVEAADRLAEVLEDVLTLSELEAGGVVPRIADFELGALLHQTREQVEAEALRKGLVLTVDAGALPLWLRGDPAMLGRALGNYVKNAVKFTAAGSVQIIARRVAEDAEGVTLLLEVRDTGPGIEPTQQPRLFGAFEPGDVSMTRRHGGAGLGLALTRRLAELMQGQVGVHSRPGRGSRFWMRVHLPRGRDTSTRPPGQLTVEATLRARYAGARVLVVDDDPVNRESASALLGAVGLKVLLAENGREALERVFAERPALVLMDLQMPEIDGLSAARELRRRGATLPILALTASDGEQILAECLAAGMDHHVHKPVEPRALYETLLHWLGSGRADAGEPEHEPGGVHAAAAEPATLPALPGVDTEDALLRSGGSATRALALLRLFVRTHADDGEQLRTLGAENRWSQLRQLAHALRGAAGNVGARTVHLAAARLEGLLDEQAPVASRQEATRVLADALTELVDGVRAVPDPESLPPPSRPAGDPAIAVAGLALLLTSGDTASASFIAEHEPELRQSLGAEFDRFNELVESFRFDEAASLLARHAA